MELCPRASQSFSYLIETLRMLPNSELLSHMTAVKHVSR